ncbi:MAG: HEPN domain-containing protein [Deltaproteobacteria bacterium]|nr:HEPN domain-containing protein [Deltaproteobacteria bacterium]
MKRRELALLYLQKAAEDEALVDEVLDSPRVNDSAIGFHCQQAAEKILKGLLAFLGQRFRKTHDLRELIDLLTDQGYPLPPSLVDIDQLTPYAVEFRYELLPLEDSSTLDRREVRQRLKELRFWVQTQILHDS